MECNFTIKPPILGVNDTWFSSLSEFDKSLTYPILESTISYSNGFLFLQVYGVLPDVSLKSLIKLIVSWKEPAPKNPTLEILEYSFSTKLIYLSSTDFKPSYGVEEGYLYLP